MYRTGLSWPSLTEPWEMIHLNKFFRAAIGALIGVLVIPVFFGSFIFFVGGRDPLPIFAELASEPFFLFIFLGFGAFGFIFGLAGIGSNSNAGGGDGGGSFWDGGGGGDGGGGDGGGG